MARWAVRGRWPQPSRTRGRDGQPLGLYVGGFSAGAFHSNQYVIELPGADDWTSVHDDSEEGNKEFGASWWEQSAPLTRLLRGVHPPALHELIDMGAEESVVNEWANRGASALTLVFDGMPLQDAVDFAEFAVEVTIGAFRFSPGPP